MNKYEAEEIELLYEMLRYHVSYLIIEKNFCWVSYGYNKKILDYFPSEYFLSFFEFSTMHIFGKVFKMKSVEFEIL